VRDVLKFNRGRREYELEQKEIHHCIVGTYKEEYGDGSHGWHIERGAPPKPTGGRIILFNMKRHQSKSTNTYSVLIDSIKFPL
jgi:hypothetical protein